MTSGPGEGARTGRSAKTGADAAGPAVELVLPTVLRAVAGRERLSVRGASVPAALESAFAQVPVLRHHLMQESGELRAHILCLVNGESLLRDEIAGTTLADGDEIRIHQAISGG